MICVHFKCLRCRSLLFLWLQNLLPWDLLDCLSWDRGRGYILLHDDLWVQRVHRPVSCLYWELSWYWGINVRCDSWNGTTDPGNRIQQWKNLKNMYICLHICLYLCECKNLRILYWDYSRWNQGVVTYVSLLKIFATWIKTELSNHKALLEIWSAKNQLIKNAWLQFDLWTIVIREFQKGMCICMYVHMSVHTCLCVCSVHVYSLNLTFSACAFPSSFVSQRHAPPWGVCVYQSEHVFSCTRHSRGIATVAPWQLEQFPRE